jgi:transcriptional regulator with XRE-family HTH domain
MSLPAIHRYIGRIINLIRKEKGIRQSELALLTGLKQPNLSRIENGLVSPRHGTLEKIAKALGVEVQVFYSESKVQEVERKWAASMGPKHAALLMSGKLVALPLVEFEEKRPLQLDNSGQLIFSRQELMLQFPPDRDLIEAQPFAARISNDAMSLPGSNEHFAPGELAIFGRAEVMSGDFVLAALKDATLFRRLVFIDADRVRLSPLNPAYLEHVAARTEIRQIFKLIKHLRNL